MSANSGIVAYRRTSSDMDMSSTDEEDTGEPILEIKDDLPPRNDAKPTPSNETLEPVLQTTNGEKIDTDKRTEKCETRNERRDSGSRSDRERDKKDDRRESNSRERRVDKSERDRRKEYDDRSRDDRPRRRRTRSRSPRHWSPSKKKYSPDRHRKSPDRRHRSPDHRHRSRHSPDFRSKRLERKAARIDKLGLELYAEPKPGSMGGVYSNSSNPAARITEQIQKRRMLWQNKKEVAPEVASEPGSSKTWEAATFKGDNDGKMTEKFKRLMGIKGDGAATAAPKPEGSSINQKQEEMFSNMEAQYQVARMATHTHRGIGLGFGTFQVPPR